MSTRTRPKAVPWRKLTQLVNEACDLLNNETGPPLVIFDQRRKGGQRGRIFRAVYRKNKRELCIECIKLGTRQGDDKWELGLPTFHITNIPRSLPTPRVWPSGHIRFRAGGLKFTIYPPYAPIDCP